MRQSFHSVSPGGLQRDTLPVRLYHLAKTWFWDPRSIDFSQDVADWRRLTPEQREVILQLTSLFQAGEEAVTLDLLPLIQVIAAEGRLEEEMYLTTFLFEEAKHVEFFSSFLHAVGVHDDLHRFHGENYKLIFYKELPEAMAALRNDPSPTAQAVAAATYNLVVEGLLAETGYHAYFSMLKSNGILPGLAGGIERTRRDESRHLAWGIYHCSRLVAADPELWPVIQARANALLPAVIGVIQELFAGDEGRESPFGLTLDMFTGYALEQFTKRMGAIERSRGKTLAQISRTLAAELNVEG